jgi:hypothetical protein
MGINVNWDNEEKTILCHTYDHGWTTEDLYNAVDENRRLLLGLNHEVDLIVDMSVSGTPPAGVLTAYQYAERQVPPNQGIVVMVEPGAVMQPFNRIIDNLAPTISKNRTVVNTLEEAREFIAQHRTGAGV